MQMLFYEDCQNDQVVFFTGLAAFLFGYHLGVVNGPLDAIAADLGFAGNAVLQGSVRLA